VTVVAAVLLFFAFGSSGSLPAAFLLLDDVAGAGASAVSATFLVDARKGLADSETLAFVAGALTAAFLGGMFDD